MNQIASKSHLGVPVKQDCFHCGESCQGKPIFAEEKAFCCEGCRTVYDILNENGLCDYYALNEVAGISQKGKAKAAYAFLEDQDVIHRLIDFRDEERTKVHFYLPQIHCSSCLWLLENLHRINPSITHGRVDFLKKELSVSFLHAEISLRAVVELLANIGYAPHINYNDLDEEKKPIISKTLYYKLGLAGFAFGNIMLLSFPEYLGIHASTDSTLVQFFGYLNILLILPVVLYSGQDYWRSAWQGLRRGHLNIDVPITLGILALFARSVFEILMQTGAGYLDSLAGLIFFLLVGKWFQTNTYAKISFDRDYKSYFPIACTLQDKDAERTVTLDKIKKGDTLLIRHGELIPADATLVDGKAAIDYSFVSGESEPVFAEVGADLYAGGRQTGGMIAVIVRKVVSNSYLTQLWNEEAFNKDQKEGQVSQLADRVAKFFTLLILSVAFVTLAYWLPKDISVAINAFTAVLIVACPCAVALSIPFTFGNVVRLLAKQQIYLKNTGVLEAMTRIQHVVFDKTGTITNTQNATLDYEGSILSAQQKAWIKSLTYHSNHPLSRRIFEHFPKLELFTVSEFQEVKGKGLSGSVEGQDIRIGSSEYILGVPSPSGLQQHSMVEIDGKHIGTFIYHGAYRPGLKNILGQIKRWARVSLLSGDNDHERTRLTPLFGAASSLHFRQQPAQKLAYIRQLQESTKGVAMVGDGLNDAGALRQSDVGIVITENTSNFTPACDIIMDASRFALLPNIFNIARMSVRIVYLAYFIALIYNIVGLSYAVQGALSPIIAAILMPLSSVTIVLIGVGLSTWLVGREKGDISSIPRLRS